MQQGLAIGTRLPGTGLPADLSLEFIHKSHKYDFAQWCYNWDWIEMDVYLQVGEAKKRINEQSERTSMSEQ